MIAILAVFVFGYYIVKKLGDFTEENCKRIANTYKMSHRSIRIATENPMLLDAVAPVLSYISSMNPHIEFYFSSGNPHRLLQRVSKGKIDIVLLRKKTADNLDYYDSSFQIACQPLAKTITALGLLVENADMNDTICVIWNDAVRSKNRDRVLSALENEYCRIKYGHFDSLN